MAQAQLTDDDIIAWRNRRTDEDEFSDNDVSDETLMQIDTPTKNQAENESSTPKRPADEINGNEAKRRLIEDAFELNLHSKKTFGNTASMHTYKVHVTKKATMSYNELNDQIEQIFDRAIAEVGKQCGPEFSRGKVVIHTTDLEPIIVPLQPYKNLSGALVTETVNNVLGSHQEIVLDSDDFDISIATISIPAGKGCTIYDNPNSAFTKQSVCTVVDPSVTCLAQAIAIAFAKASVVEKEHLPPKVEGKNNNNQLLLDTGKCSKSHYNNILDKNRNERLDLARCLCTRTGVSVKGELSIADIPKFERLLNCNIVAISTACNKQVVYPGCGRYEKILFVLHTLNAKGRGHFHTISDVCKFYGLGCYCFPCLKPFRKGNHKCAHYCHLCESFGCKPGEPWKCPKCNFTFQSTDCFERHLQVPDDDKYKGKNKKIAEADKLSRCDRIKMCPDCNAYLNYSKRSLEEHVCFEKYCKYCKNFTTEENHQCFQRADEISDAPQKLLFYDAETSTSEETVKCKGGFKPDAETGKCTNCNQIYCGQKRHTPVLIVSETACGICQDKEVEHDSVCANCGSRCTICSSMRKGKFEKRPCSGTCGLRRKVFYGKQCLWDFYIFLMQEYHKGITVIAHNGSKFDHYFILQQALDHGVVPTNVCIKGTKIIFMNLPHNITCLDSYSFLPFPLAKFKDTLGLDVNCNKFDFPYDFIKSENLAYVGPWPSLEQYSANRYDTEEFKEWHEEQKNKTFDFKAELTSYCIQDVAILRKGALKFQGLIHDLTAEKDEEGKILVPGVLAFTKPTLASLAMHVFRAKFLWETHLLKNIDGEEMKARYQGGRYYSQDEKGEWKLMPTQSFLKFVDSPIAACPNDNYLQRDNFSQVSIKWLMWKEQQLGVPVQTALSPEGEKTVPTTATVTYRLDGYVAPEHNNDKPLALEFLGCHYHGHSYSGKCNDKVVKYSEAWKSAKELHDRTAFKIEALSQQGYDIETIWECEYHKQLADNPEMKAFVDSAKVAPRLKIRDAIYGGRVSPVTLMAEATGGNDKIHFADICSLYPSRMRDETFMVGHPQILRDVDPSLIPELFGYAYCRILPPRDLFFPLLPTREDGKLMFVLCQTCGTNKLQDECKHSEDERCIEGVYTTPELQKAIELGYEVQEVYEAWHWDQTTSYRKGEKFSGLFAEYVNLFLKVKTEASGWPAGVETLEQKEQYVQDYYEREGIHLDKDKIEYNPAMRSIAKLLLNSLFGKFIQKANVSSSKFFFEKDIRELHELLLDPLQTVTDFHIITPSVIMIEHKTSKASQRESDFTNPAIGAFITSYGRLKLYETLELLQDKVLYYDTDSAMFKGGKNIEDSVPLGPFLGELESELKPGDYIDFFASLGCKSYAYTSAQGKKVVKAKGFTLKGQTDINIDSMSNILKKEQEARLNNKFAKNNSITIEQFNIRRVKEQQALYNTTEKKSFKFTFDKRKVNWEDFTSLPYGYM